MKRRQFVGSAMTAALCAPFVRFLNVNGQTPADKKFVYWFHPTGSLEQYFFPKPGALAGQTLPRILAPLQAFVGDMVVFDGIAMRSLSDDEVEEKYATGHNAMGHILYGGKTYKKDASREDYHDGPGGETLDLFLARSLSANKKFPSYRFGVYTMNYNPHQCAISATKAGQVAYAQNDPWQAFSDLFGGEKPGPVAGGASVVDPQLVARLKARKSTMDAVAGELTRLRSELPPEERPALEAHLESYRSIEKRLTDLPVPGAQNAQCIVPTLDAKKLDPEKYQNTPRLIELQSDILVSALACGKTSVASLQLFSGAVSSFGLGPTKLDWVDGITLEHHWLQHLSTYDGVQPGRVDILEQRLRQEVWQVQQFAALVQRLKNFAVGGASMLDQTCVLFCTNMANSGAHDAVRMPWLTVGNAGGTIRTGQCLKFSADMAHNNLHISIAKALGQSLAIFGDPKLCLPGGLPGYLA